MKQLNQPISLKRIAQAMLAVAVIFAVTLVMDLIGVKILGEGAIALLYLIPIGWCTVRWGKTAGVSAALTAALSFDFLFIPPYGTFNIGSFEGWLLLFLFIAASILVVGRIQWMLSDERSRERKATFLYEMISAIANQQTREGIARAIANQLQQQYLAKYVQVQLNARGKFQELVVHPDGSLEYLPEGKPELVLPIISAMEWIGEIVIWKGALPLPPEGDPMFQSMLRQTAAAIERVHALHGNDLSISQLQKEVS